MLGRITEDVDMVRWLPIAVVDSYQTRLEIQNISMDSPDSLRSPTLRPLVQITLLDLKLNMSKSFP